jgi:DNA polymerase-3 subunit delta'
MSFFPDLVGSDEIRERIGKTIRSHRLSHAYLIEGPCGSGKRTFARMIAAALSCREATDTEASLPCGKCPSCQKILADNAPDVHLIDRGDAATVGVDSIRRLREEMMLSASESDIRVFIIADADSMTAAAQNALLIVLEEPPKNTLLLLLCESAERLLPTIRSRAQLLRMGYVSEGELEGYLLSHIPEAAALKSKSPEQLAAIISAADGRIGEAERLLRPKTEAALLKLRESVTSLAVAFVEAKSYGAVYTALSSLPSKRPELAACFPMLLRALRDLSLLRREPEITLLFFTDRSAALALARRADFARLVRIYDAVSAAENDILSNANIPLALTALAASIFYGSSAPT